MVIQNIIFNDIDELALALPQTRRPYGRLLAAHCKAAYGWGRVWVSSLYLSPYPHPLLHPGQIDANTMANDHVRSFTLVVLRC
jgi:hypothetical protein